MWQCGNSTVVCAPWQYGKYVLWSLVLLFRFQRTKVPPAFACTPTLTITRKQTHEHTNTHVTYTHAHTCTYTCTYTHAHACTHMHKHTHTTKKLYTHTHAHLYAFTHMHTHTMALWIISMNFLTHVARFNQHNHGHRVLIHIGRSRCCRACNCRWPM